MTDDKTVPPPNRAPLVYGAVVDLMKLVEEIGKNRRGPAEAGGYQFRGVDDAMNAVGSAMRQVGLIMRTEMCDYAISHTPGTNNRTWTTVIVKARYVFVHPDDGSEHILEMYGEGRDLGDKAVSKAMSAAMKYALFQGLNIPVKGINMDQSGTGQDPENDHPVDTEPARPPTQSAAERPAAQSAPEPAIDPVARAHAALKAVQAANDIGAINGVIAQARKEGLLNVEIDGVRLQQAIVAFARTLPQAPS